MTDDTINLTPQQIAELKRQLQEANARLIAVERRQQELRDYIATLTAQLQRAESGGLPDQS
jgi:septal ring factor EnvC (AmiA/AmiB activator)